MLFSLATMMDSRINLQGLKVIIEKNSSHLTFDIPTHNCDIEKYLMQFILNMLLSMVEIMIHNHNFLEFHHSLITMYGLL